MYSSSGSSTPAEACEKARVVADRSPDWNYTSATPKMNGLDNSYCSVVYVSRRDPSVVNTCDDCASWKLFRKGDQCANADDTYNASTGICEPPPKECKEGELFPAKGPDSPVVTSGGRNYVGDGGAPTACYQSCEYGGNPSPASCYLVKGSTTTGFCNYILKGTGQSCGADSYTFSQTGDSLNPPDTPNTDPSDPNDPGCPPGWSWSGTTCVKTPTDPTDPTDPTTPGGDGAMAVETTTAAPAMAATAAGEGTATAGAMVAATVTAAARAAMATAPATRRKRTAPPAPKAPAANSRNPRPAPGMTPSPPGKRRSRTPRKNSRPR